MSKMSEMEATISELRDIASSINDIANWLTGAFSGTEEAAPAPEPEKALTLEEVRAILAEKSRDGFTAQIRGLLLKYGAKKTCPDPVVLRQCLGGKIHQRQHPEVQRQPHYSED